MAPPLLLPRLAALLLLTLGSSYSVFATLVGDFESGSMDGWEPQSFKGETDYTIVEIDHQRALRADSQGSASGLHRSVNIDLQKTPYLNWSWRVEQPLTGLDETTKQGDDYAARIYLIHSNGIFFWDTQALSYVWSGSQAEGTAWPNAYTANSINIAVAHGSEQQGQWVHHKRNVREDFMAQFSRQVDTVSAIAIMTDTDNSNRAATAYYGNIYFSAE